MNKLLTLIAVFALMFCMNPLSSCKGLEDTRPDIAKQYLKDRIAEQSHGAISLVSFEKTDGKDQTLLGMTWYEMTFTFQVRIDQQCWKVGNGIEGYFSNFVTYAEKPDFWKQYENAGQASLFTQGFTQTLKGKATFEKSENGWAVKNMVTY
ncbi:MAG: hypothetical protein JST83_11840 [Bacteroidetes bacterium]|nr:hypothetical protein [Bacteroidota bacterium]